MKGISKNPFFIYLIFGSSLPIAIHSRQAKTAFIASKVQGFCAFVSVRYFLAAL